METFNHTCIKKDCGITYQDTDPDPYYCQSCLEEKKAVAKKLDKQFANRTSSVPLTPLQEYDRAEKVNMGGISLMRYKP